MNFSASDIKSLREQTGCGMMDCKKALVETNGDVKAAVDFLRKKGLASASKKSGRIAAEGLAVAYSYNNGTTGVAIEVNCETDFVAINSDFQNFVKECADTICEKNPSTVDELLTMNANDKNQTIGGSLQEKIFVIGENIKIRRFKRMSGIVFSYIHAGGKIGVLVNFSTDPKIANTEEFKNFAKDITLQIAASAPSYLIKDDVPLNEIEHEKKILSEQIINEGKPQNIAEKIVLGRIGKYYKDVCLMDQTFVKDSSITVRDFVKNTEKILDTKIKIVEFVRFEKGQGLEKKDNNLQNEVANIMKNSN